MRIAGGIVLWFVATLIGASSAGWFALAGLGWSDGFIHRSFWEAGESEIGVGFGVIALVVWLVLLALSGTILRRGSLRDSRRGRTAAIVLSVASIITVAALCVLAIGWPELPSETPSLPWNRA